MVTSPSGKGVVVIGGLNLREGKISNALHELKGISNESKWVTLEQKLEHAKYFHVAIPIHKDWSPN